MNIMYLHKIPVHLDTEDKFLWSLTFRQVLILFIGGGLAYFVGTTDWSSPLTALLCIVGGGLCLIMTLLVAFVKFKGRNLDQWALVAFLFYSSPQIFCWSALPEQQQDTQDILKKEWADKEEEEEW